MSEIEITDDLLEEFLIESSEGLDQIEQDLVILEQNPSSEETLGQLFRTVHTLKGSSGFLHLSKLEKVTHVGENLLSLIRDRELTLTAEITSALLQMSDAVREILGHLESKKTEGPGVYEPLVELLDRLARADAAQEQAEPSSSEGVAEAVEEPGAATESTVAHSVSDTSIRVDVGLLDTLMNLVGELVLARNQVLQHCADQEDAGFITTSQRLNLVTTELQEGVMKTRMQPIGKIWSKFPRVVRDLAVSCGKEIEIEMEGRETELDKTIIESIKDPLTHAIRNAVDHGIESSEARLKAGKPAQGRIVLRAYHEGGQVNIEIVDDGGGIDPEKIRDKALSTGLITSEQVGRMSEKELINLITLPGFSTAGKVTNVSGRGVGMDVVKTNVEKIGGVMDIQSVLGQGTTLKIKIPLTLAIIPALIVTSGSDRFAIPQVSLLELLRLEGAQIRDEIEMVHGCPVYRLRGNLLPLAYLDTELGKPRVAEHELGEGEEPVINIVVLQADEHQFGLVVEDILDTEEIVVKPLGKILKGVSSFAGAAIMGDGKIALILDVLGLAQRANMVTGDDRVAGSSAHSIDGGSSDSESDTLLLVRVGRESRAAILLSKVHRLEEFDPDSVEQTAGQEVVQYRGEIMPLVRLSDHLGTESDQLDSDAKLQVIVVQREEGQSAGLIVDQILDIVEEDFEVVRHSARKGIEGAIAVQGKVTDLLDVEGIVRASMFETQAPRELVEV